MKKIFDKILLKINNKIIFMCFSIIILSGHILNLYCEHKNFYFNQYFLICMLILEIYILKKIKKENEKTQKLLSECQEIEVYSSFIAKQKNFVKNVVNDTISFVLVVFYIFSMYMVGCLDYTKTGFFFGLLGALIFYLGIQSYFQYLSLLYFAYDLKNLEIKKYFFYSPALTEWVEQLAREFNVIEKWFLILGSMYSIIYAVNLPPGTFVLSDSLLINTPCNFLFYLTWIGIIILFVIAIPSFIFLSRLFIKDCIYMCKRKSINTIKKQINMLSQQSTEEDLKMIDMKIKLINEITNSECYPLKYSRTIFDNAYTIFFSIITSVSPLISIIEQFIF